MTTNPNDRQDEQTRAPQQQDDQQQPPVEDLKAKQAAQDDQVKGGRVHLEY